MNYNTWGDIISRYFNKIIIKKLDSNAFYHIEQFDNYYFVEYKVNDAVILKFTDESLDNNNLSIFRRTVDDKKIFDFLNGEIILKRKIIEEYLIYLN